jgi:hypothetical protein
MEAMPMPVSRPECRGSGSVAESPKRARDPSAPSLAHRLSFATPGEMVQRLDKRWSIIPRVVSGDIFPARFPLARRKGSNEISYGNSKSPSRKFLKEKGEL